MRAFAAYAGQRYDVGDGIRMRESIRRAHELVPSLDPSRAKERLAVMFAEGLFHGLRALGADRDDFLAVEHIAKRRGYPRTWIAARAERIGTDLTFTNGCDHFLDAIVGPLEPNNRRTMPGVLADVALIASQCERDVERRISASLLAESLAPPRSATALFARALRGRQLFAQNRYDEAWHLARTVHGDAELLGNGRVRGAAARRPCGDRVRTPPARRGDALHSRSAAPRRSLRHAQLDRACARARQKAARQLGSRAAIVFLPANMKRETRT